MNLVLIESEGCMPCKRMKHVMQNIEYDSINSDEDATVINRYNIRGLPTLIMYQDGYEIKRHVGVMTELQLNEFIGKK